MKVAVGAILTSIVLALGIAIYSQNITDKTIPEPYHGEISALRAKNFDFQKQCIALEKQIDDLRAKQRENVSQINELSAEAVVSAGLTLRDYIVDTDSMTIIRRQTLNSNGGGR
jgi:peptidoglycan hydrolase CwlO-like protein